MRDKGLSDRERALLQAARREVTAKVSRPAAVDTAGARGAASHRTKQSASPFDVPTVLGWDHPAAQEPPGAAKDKWARVADLMATERIEAAEKRAKIRRGAIIFLACLLLIVVILGTRSLMR